MKKKSKRIPPVGELRQSQVITTFGPGAMVDLPDHAVLIGGLDDWHGDRARIDEERLEGRVEDLLRRGSVKLFAPPVDDGDRNAVSANIPAIQFPTWFLGQIQKTYVDERGRRYRTRPLVRWNQLRDGKYFDEDRKKRPIVPIRFVRACVRGHLGDVDWYAFVHRDYESRQVGQLWFDEGGAGNDFQEIFVRLAPTAQAHGPRRPLSDATVPEGFPLGMCTGRMPWLGPRVKEPCDKPAKLLTRSASNAYFAQTLSVISIPDLDSALKEAVATVFEDFLQYAESLADVTRERKKQKVFYALEGHTDDDVWAEVQRRKKGGGQGQSKSIKQAEIETLLAAPLTMGEDKPEGLYYARARDPSTIPAVLGDRLTGVVLVHKLREVIAQVGFTRFEAAMPDIDGELSLEVELAPLAREMSWVPANENKGEGIFLSFSDDAIADWLDEAKNPGIKDRKERLLAGFEAWARRKDLEDVEFPGLPYLMLHSLAHLLITAVSLECGYSASSIRERVYAGEWGHGILLYTGGAGSEGTLGGLVQVGRSIEHHLARALEQGRLCSNDPVCAQHDPANLFEERFLHGAACHGCLLVAETSCERRNELLDRSLVVPTVSTPEAAFFPDLDAIHEALRLAASTSPLADEASVATPEVVWSMSDLRNREPPEGAFMVQVEPEDAPDRRSARYRCAPLTQPMSDLREGSLILVKHPSLTRGGAAVGVGLGRWMVRKMVDAATSEPREKLILRGPIPPPELDLSPAEWAVFQPLGRLTRVEG